MSFSPVVPTGGLAGWAFLTRTAEAQKAAFLRSPGIARDEAYFREKIGGIESAEALVSDRRLLGIALKAFGLGDDIDNRYFIRKVLEDGTLTRDALGHKLADKRYLSLSAAFGFGDFAVPRTVLSDFADDILSKFEAEAFEEAVGETRAELRLALNAKDELADLASGTGGADAAWYRVMGSAPLREVFQTAFGLPDSFAGLDLVQQLGEFRSRAERYLGAGEISQFADPDRVESLIRLYLVRADASSGSATTPGAAALSLLGGAASGASILSLLV